MPSKTTEQHVRDLDENKVALKTAYERVFNNDDGRSVLMNMFRQFGMDGTTLVYDRNGAIDALAMAHKEGQRSVVMGILNALNADLTPYVENMRKHKEERD